jgi:hypothetical protein
MLPVLEGDAPADSESVGETLTVALAERVVEGVSDPVLVGVAVGGGAPEVGTKGAAVALHVGVALKLAPLLPLAEAARDTLAAPALLAAPGVRAAVGDAVPV